VYRELRGAYFDMKGDKRFHFSNYSHISTRLALVLFVLSFSLTNLFFHQSLAFTGADYDKTDLAISRYLNVNTLEPANELPGLLAVEVKNDDTLGSGGPPSEETPSSQYTIKEGDTLSTIADKYGMSSGSLVLANQGVIKDPEDIQPGQIITIPSHPYSQAELAKEYASRATTTTSHATIGSFPTNLHFGTPIYFSYISQGFNPPVHYGEDLVAPTGTIVRATESGQVSIAQGGWNGGYGNYVVIDHGNHVDPNDGVTKSYSSRYGHLSVIEVVPGEWVTKGEEIGRSGSTGNSTGPHLHFEIRKNGVAVNPGI